MNYTTLQADVASYLHRSDLTTPIQSFIERARVRIGRDLRSAEQITTTTLSSFTNDIAALPTDFQEMVRVESAGRALRPVSQTEIAYWASLTSAEVYTIANRNICIPGASSADLWYYRQEAALSSGSTEHATMAAHPQVWLLASLAEGHLYVQDTEEYMKTLELYQAEVAAINRAHKRLMTGPAPAVTTQDYFVDFAGPNL